MQAAVSLKNSIGVYLVSLRNGVENLTILAHQIGICCHCNVKMMSSCHMYVSLQQMCGIQDFLEAFFMFSNIK